MKTASSLAAFTTSFQQFRRIISLNNCVLETIAHMESALSGEYVFDRKFLFEALESLIELVREVIYSVNSLSGDHYLVLYERFEELADKLIILADKLGVVASDYTGPYDHRLTLAYDVINGDFEELVGGKNATLSEIRNRLHLRVPDGFAITVLAYQEFMEENGLFPAIDTICNGSGTSREHSERIEKLLRGAHFSERLAAAVQDELDRLLFGRGLQVLLAIRSSGVGEDSASRSFAGQFHSVLGVKPDLLAVLEAYRQVIASRFSAVALEYLGRQSSSHEIPMAVGVQTMIKSRVAGVTYSRVPDEPERNVLLVTALRGAARDLVDGSRTADRFVVNRIWPFQLETSEIILSDFPAAELEGLDIGENGLRRGSASLTPKELAMLAEQALLLEKAFGDSQDIEWVMGDELVILQSRPLSLPAVPQPLPGELADELSHATPLLSGKGQVAQLGVAAGKVVHVDQNTVAEQFPVGAIAVARFPSPHLSPIVWRAAAIITDSGGPTGHLATIAREYRTPALFGAGNATRLLAEGAEITVDVENKQVYQGIIKGLIRPHVAEKDDYYASKELRILRRILRWVAPLTLPDPTDAGFIAENCQTFHDIIRFSHEKAIDALIHFHAEDSSKGAMQSRSVRLPVPLRLRVIDLGAGLKPDAPSRGEIGLEMVACRPLLALLSGFFKDAGSGRETGAMSFRDLLSGINKPLALFDGPSYPGDNLGIIADDYCNLCLRLGYHINVVDAHMTPDTDNNSIYFRFSGGMAEQSMREWRASLIGAILSGLYFKVERKGDLVIGKARSLDLPQMERVLTRLGELISFTRQLDVQMRDETAIEHFFQRFLGTIKEEQSETGPGYGQ